MQAVPWLRRLAVGLSLRRHRFVPGSLRVGHVVDKVALGQVFPVNIIPPWLSILVYRLGDEKKGRWWSQFRDMSNNVIMWHNITAVVVKV
jgi:hypothetical protein